MQRLGMLVLLGACGDPHQTLLDRVVDDASVSGCARIAVSAWVEVEGEAPDVRLNALLLLDEADAIAAGDRWERDLARADDALVHVLYGPDLSQNSPCDHVPLPVTTAGRADAGTLTLEAAAAPTSGDGGDHVPVHLTLHDVAVPLDDGTRVHVPHLAWTDVDVFLDAE